MKIDLNYIFLNLGASLKIMLGDVRGLSEIDRSAAGFWRSFLALVLASPFALSTKYSEYDSAVQAIGSGPGFSAFFAVLALEVAALLAYLLSLAVLYAMTKSTGMESRFPLSVVALNWGSFGMTILTFPFLVAMGLLANDNALLPFLVLILMVVFALAMFNIIRLTLQISSRPAILYVFVLSVFEIIAYFVLLGIAGF